MMASSPSEQLSRPQLDALLREKPYVPPCQHFSAAPWDAETFPDVKVHRSAALKAKMEAAFAKVVPSRTMQRATTVGELLGELEARTGAQIFAMGGYLRDLLQGKSPNDLDVCVATSPHGIVEMGMYAEELGLEYSLAPHWVQPRQLVKDAEAIQEKVPYMLTRLQELDHIVEVQQNENRKFELAKAKIEGDKNRRLEEAQHDRDAARTSIHDEYRMQALLLAAIPGLLVGLLTYFRRRGSASNIPLNRRVGGSN